MTAELVLSTPGLVHPILTTDQAELTHQALIAFLNLPEGSFSEHELEEQAVRAGLSELVFFFSNVVDHPDAFGVRSATETKRIVRGAKPAPKGPAQPPNKRKAAQAKSQGAQKRTRREKKVEAEDYNRAKAISDAEAAEGEQIRNEEMIAKIERFNELLVLDDLSNEQMQELLDLLGYPQIAVAAREMRAANTPEARIAAAQAKAAAENDGEE